MKIIAMGDPDDTWTLGDTRRWLRARVEDGVECPCCHQRAQIYNRQIHSTMAKALITLYRHQQGDEFVHTARLPGDTHEMSELSWWGLIEEEKTLRPDGGKAGRWRLTDGGRQFVENTMGVPKYALIYDGELLAYDGKPVTIKDCLGKKFSYTELMAGR